MHIQGATNTLIKKITNKKSCTSTTTRFETALLTYIEQHIAFAPRLHLHTRVRSKARAHKYVRQAINQHHNLRLLCWHISEAWTMTPLTDQICEEKHTTLHLPHSFYYDANRRTQLTFEISWITSIRKDKTRKDPPSFPVRMTTLPVRMSVQTVLVRPRRYKTSAGAGSAVPSDTSLVTCTTGDFAMKASTSACSRSFNCSFFTRFEEVREKQNKKCRPGGRGAYHRGVKNGNNVCCSSCE